MTIREYVSSDDLEPCVPVMRILREHLDPEAGAVAARLRRQMMQGYRLMALIQNDRPVALIGFRLMENLVFGHFLYVDDLVVATDDRGKGHATQLLAAVREIAHETGQDLVVLDTALSNETALRLYRKNGFERVAYRLIQRLER